MLLLLPVLLIQHLVHGLHDSSSGSSSGSSSSSSSGSAFDDDASSIPLSPPLSHHSSTPVVGVLTEPGWNSQSHYIAASYIKWLEAGGARAIPIPYDASSALIHDIWTQINGLLLPGGDCTVPPGVTDLLTTIRDSNARDAPNHYFPVWGTCLGFEFLLSHVGGATALQGGFDASNISWPLDEVNQRRELYADPVTYHTVVNRAVTMNSHHQGIEPEHFATNPLLTAVWDVTSTNVDRQGRRFVSTIEPRDPERFPWYGVQYHPEKNAFEYSSFPGTDIPYEDIDHSEEGVAFSVYLARFFVDRVRHGQEVNLYHSYTQPDRYPLVTTYPIQTGLHFEQIYIVPAAAHWNDTERFVIA